MRIALIFFTIFSSSIFSLFFLRQLLTVDILFTPLIIIFDAEAAGGERCAASVTLLFFFLLPPFRRCRFLRLLLSPISLYFFLAVVTKEACRMYSATILPLLAIIDAMMIIAASLPHTACLFTP